MMFYELSLCDQTQKGCDRTSFIFSLISQFTKFLFLIESSFNKEKYIETFLLSLYINRRDAIISFLRLKKPQLCKIW